VHTTDSTQVIADLSGETNIAREIIDRVWRVGELTDSEILPLMAKHQAPDDWVRLEDPPGEVQTALLSDPDDRMPHDRRVGIQGITLGRATVVIVLVLAAVAMGAAVVGALAGGRDRAARRDTAGAELAGPAGVAAAYGYPPRCLSVTIAHTNHAYARADFDHSSACGRYDGYVTAIFYRIDGAWLPVLDATSYSCPVATLPTGVQNELGVCP
jgi:hypothetical protein